MNLSPRPYKTDEEKHRFFELAAKRYKAECRLYGVQAMIHIENKNDEVLRRVLKDSFKRVSVSLLRPGLSTAI